MSDAHAGVANECEDLYKPLPPEDLDSGGSSPISEPFRVSSVRTRPRPAIQSGQLVTIIEVLEYMKRAFDDETVLDTLPLEAAGNSGA